MLATAAATEPALLGQLLDASAAEHADRPALVCGEVTLTFAELRDRVARVAGGLEVEPGDPVALLLPNGPELVVGLLALARLGAVAVPLNPGLKRAELAFCLAESGARTAIAGDPARPWPDGVRVISPAAGDAGELPPRSPDEDAVFLYSSGSTGRSKRVPRTQRQLVAEADGLVATTGIGPSDTIFCAIPLFHAYGLGCCLLAALGSGAALALPAAPVLAPARLLPELERTRATVLPAVPFILRGLAEAGGADLPALRLCLSAANPLPRSVFDAFERAFALPIRQLYGCTEAGAVTVNLDEDPWTTASSVGAPIAGVSIDVLDAAGEPVERGRIGEIAIRSPAMTRGYAGVPEAVNRAAFPGGAFLTGDRGRVDDDARLFVTGRRKRLIDVRGDKVDPVEVEDVLAVHPRVRDVVVVGVDSGVEGEELVKAVVVGDGRCAARELVRFCRERLANYKVPQVVEIRDEIPRSAAGEVLRKYLV